MTSYPTLFQKYNFDKIKQIWTSLSQESKETIFKLENPEILSDLSNRANNARLTCQLDKNYRKKDLIIWERDKEAMVHKYHFNMIRKDVLKNSNLAELFSSFCMIINLNSKQAQGSSSQTIQKSSFEVEKEKLDLFIEILYRNSSSLNVLSKDLFKAQNQFHTYTFLTTYFSQESTVLDDIDSFILQDLFSSFLAIAIIFFENFSAFVSTTPAFVPALIPPKDISSQLNDLALILNSSQQPLSANIKSVTEIERTLHNHSSCAESDNASKDNHSNFSSSPRSTTSERKGSKDLVNELNCKVNTNNGRYHDRKPIQQGQGRVFEQDRITRSAIMRSDIKSEPLYNRPRQIEDESPNNAFAIYNGLSMGDLSMDFKVSDVNLILEGDEDENNMVNKVNNIRARSGSGTLLNGTGDFTPPLLMNENHAHFFRQAPPHFIFPQQAHYGFYPIIYAAPPPTNNLLHPIMNNEPMVKRTNNHIVEPSSHPELISANSTGRKDGRERSIDSHSSQEGEKEHVKNTVLSSSSSYTGDVYNRNLVKEAEKLHHYPKDSNNNNKAKVRLPPRFKK